jgi:hypothetical protein
MTDVWAFDLDATAWAMTVPGAPTEETKRRFWDEAVPVLASAELPRVEPRCVVVARVTAPTAPGRSAPAGPRGRAKGLLDALHDDRQSGPKYVQLAGRAPLAGDDPRVVGGLAVEVRPGAAAQVEYRVGHGLRVARQLLLELDVDAAGPNDIAATPSDTVSIGLGRKKLATAVQASWAQSKATVIAGQVKALVVHHHPGRDEDNTWSTWMAALCGASSTGSEHWAFRAPMIGANPTSFASVADPALPTATRFRLYG